MVIHKILLVNPPGSSHIYANGLKQTKEGPPPIGLAYLAAQVRDKYNVKVYDMIIENFDQEVRQGNTMLFGDTFEQFLKVLKDYKPDLVGISCVLSNRSNQVLKLCQLAKEFNKNIITVVGGHHSSAMPKHILQRADYVLLGEADYSFPKLVDILNKNKSIEELDGIAYKKNGKVIIKPQTTFVKDLDSLPFPAWDLVNLEKYWNEKMPMGVPLKSKKYAVMMTSRGCPHCCYYCALPQHAGKRNYRERSSKDVIKEIKWLRDKYGIEEIQFFDDNFSINNERVKRLCKLLIANFPGMLHFAVPSSLDPTNLDLEAFDLLKQAGFHNLQLGIETADKDIRKKYVNKKLDIEKVKEKIKYMHQIGLEPSAFFLLGFPDETTEQIKKTVDLIEFLSPYLDKINMPMLTPLPGSQLYDYCVKNDLLYDDFNFAEIHYSEPYVKNPNIPREKLMEIKERVQYRHFKSNIGFKI